MKFFCPHCGQKLSCNDDEQGTVVSCPNCANEITVPTLIKQSEQQLKENEELVLISGSPSKVYYSYLLFPFFCSVLVAIVRTILSNGVYDKNFWSGSLFGSPLFILLVIIYFIKIKTHKFVFTNKRLTVRDGIIFIEENQTRISDIRGITVRKWLWDLVCKTGTISIGTASTGVEKINLRHIHNPQKIVEKIEELRKQVK